MKSASLLTAILSALICCSCRQPVAPAPEEPAPAPRPSRTLTELWGQGKAVFGVYVPDENPLTREERQSGMRRPPTYSREGGALLAGNPLYDFLFLNLEGNYDSQAVKAIAEGLQSGGQGPEKTLLVRIPPISHDGEEAARSRVKEILDSGADGVILPHVRNLEEARLAISFFNQAGANVWSPTNPSGDVLAMLMLEDPEAVAQAPEIADLPGYSILACGIGSLTQAMGGDREGAEAANQQVLAEARRAGLADMITANAEDIAGRVEQGFLALLMRGPTADEAIRIGRKAARREEGSLGGRISAGR